MATSAGLLRPLQPLHYFIKGSAPSEIPLTRWASMAYYGLSCLPLGRCISKFSSSNSCSCIITDWFIRLLSKVFISSIWLSMATSHLSLTILWLPPNWAMLGSTCSLSDRGSKVFKNEIFYEPVTCRWHELTTQAEWTVCRICLLEYWFLSTHHLSSEKSTLSWLTSSPCELSWQASSLVITKYSTSSTFHSWPLIQPPKRSFVIKFTTVM